MKITARKVVVAVVALMGAIAAGVSGCAHGERPFLMVQLCVGDQRGLDLLKNELQSIATSEGMQFQDASKHTEEDLKAMKYAGKERTDDSPVVQVDVGREDGMGVGAGNLSLPGYQVALGFSKGRDEAEARAFASRVIAVIEKHWTVHRVPDGQGAMPMAGC